VKLEQISEKYKGVFTDVQSRILSYDGLNKIMKGSNSEAKKLSNWFENFRNHISPDVVRIFRREWNSQIRFTAKLAASGETLGPTALTYLNRGEWLDLEVLKFYTHRQIEKFGLEDVVCYLAVDNDKMALNYVGGEMLTEGDMIASPDRKISTVQYCVCAMNLGEFHFVSLFASRQERKLYINDPSRLYSIHNIDIEENLLKVFFDAWKVKLKIVRDTKRNFQNDDVNCGVYSAEYNEQVLNAIKVCRDQRDQFRMPELLSVDANLMSAGVYRWRMAEFILHDNVGLPLSDYCYLLNYHMVGYSRSDLEKLVFKNGEETVVCTTCTRSYRKSEREVFVAEHNQSKIPKELHFVKNYTSGDYCAFCRSSDNLETRQYRKTTECQDGRQVGEIPKKMDPESPKLLTTPKREVSDDIELSKASSYEYLSEVSAESANTSIITASSSSA